MNRTGSIAATFILLTMFLSTVAGVIVSGVVGQFMTKLASEVR